MDRNTSPHSINSMILMSLSARRAWIEIKARSSVSQTVDVALRKESVDRNASSLNMLCSVEVALRKESVDRNHIAVQFDTLSAVALRKESVDRNEISSIDDLEPSSRSPQGERG